MLTIVFRYMGLVVVVVILAVKHNNAAASNLRQAVIQIANVATVEIQPTKIQRQLL